MACAHVCVYVCMYVYVSTSAKDYKSVCEYIYFMIFFSFNLFHVKICNIIFWLSFSPKLFIFGYFKSLSTPFCLVPYVLSFLHFNCFKLNLTVILSITITFTFSMSFLLLLSLCYVLLFTISVRTFTLTLFHSPILPLFPILIVIPSFYITLPLSI